jgi:exodeoxyribonuclease VII small subunit
VTDEVSFEDARRELEQIVAKLESGQASLEEAVALWERGELLYRSCVAKLDAAQGKIEELGKRVEEARP